MKRIALVLCLLCLPAIAQERRAQVFELGPQVSDNIKAMNGYAWRATGYIYPPGTLGKADDCAKPAETVRPVGVWIAQGWYGDADNHSAQYRLIIYGQGNFYFRGDVGARDGKNAPAALLFPIYQWVGGTLAQVSESDRAVYEPHGGCFGGRLLLFVE